MRVLVRRVNEWDAPTMLKVYEPYIKSNATEDEVQPTIAEFVQRIDKYTYGTGWIISEIDGETGGFCLLTESRPKDVFTNEIKLFVKPGYKRRGVGASLYSLMLDMMEAGNKRAAIARIPLPNDEAVAFHQSFGFYEVCVEKCGMQKGGKAYDVLVMKKDLKPYDGKAEKPVKPFLIDAVDYERSRIRAASLVKRRTGKEWAEMINGYIRGLVDYGLECGLIRKEDEIYTLNQILDLLDIDEYEEPQEACSIDLEELLGGILDYAADKGIIEDNIVARDLFDTKIMGAVTPKPSQVIDQFKSIYASDPSAATDYFYKTCCDCDYIRRYRIQKDIKWVYASEYGGLDITINLSKPEKDPKAIAAAKNTKQGGYPKCQLCRENIGYRGRANHPARQNLRVIPVTINGEEWGFQYSPYVYYNEHCIVFNGSHVPMKIDRSTFVKLFDFVQAYPHYFVGSNADLPIVGGSILTHDHFQGGRYDFAMAKAEVETPLEFEGYSDVSAGIVKWPMSVIRLSGKDTERIIGLADKILTAWRGYTDEDAFIFAETDGEPHNTITPIARKVGDDFQLDLVLRNNITTEEHPLGVFHPHSELHHIKKENIGLIEVMGLAVLPSRLKEEMKVLGEWLAEGKDISKNPMLKPHLEWALDIMERHPSVHSENVDQILKQEIGAVFAEVLEHAGVYKRNEEGRAAFIRFAEAVR